MASAATLPPSGCSSPRHAAGSSLSKASAASAQLPPPHPPAPHPPHFTATALPTRPADPSLPSTAATRSPSLPQPRPIFRQWQPHCSLPQYLHQSPSVLSGLSLSAIHSRHDFALSFVSSLASHLRFPFRVLSTATALYHLAFFRLSLTHYTAVDVAVASLFLACKVEDAPRKLLEVVRGWMELETQEGDAAAASDMDSSAKEDVSDAAAAEQEDEDAAEQDASPFRSLDGSVELDEERNAAAERLRRSKQAAAAAADSETETERQRRLRLLHLESEILLAADYNFALPQPAAYLRSLLRSLTQLQPLSPALAPTAEGVRWRVTAEVVAKRVDALYCSAMALLKSGLKSSASLHFSPQAISVACVMLAALSLDINLHHVAELTDFTSALPSPFCPPPPPAAAAASSSALHDDGAPDTVAFSPSSTTSALSPLYSESPSSPSSSSPASLTSLSSSLSQSLAVPAKTAEMPQTVAASSPAPALPSSMQQPPPPPWYRALLPALSESELVTLLVLLLEADTSSPLCSRLRKLHPFSQALQQPQSARAGKAALELVDVLKVRAEWEQELAVRMAEWREKEEAERKAREEQEKAMKEAREAADAELKMRQREEEERKERELKRAAQEEPQARRDRADRQRAASPRRRPSIDRAEERASSSISSGSSGGWRARDSSYREHRRDWRESRERRSSRDRDRDRDKDRERDRDKERRPQASSASTFVSTVRPSGFISTTTATATSAASHRAGQPLPVSSRPSRRSRSPSPQSPPSKRRRRRSSRSPPRSPPLSRSRSRSRSPDSRRGRRREGAGAGSGGERRSRRRQSRSDDSGSSDDERGRLYRRPHEQSGDRSGRRSGDTARRR